MPSATRSGSKRRALTGARVATRRWRRRGAKHQRRPMPKHKFPTLGRVVYIEDDGKYIKAEYTRANCEKVIGIYERIGWMKAPQAVVDDINERLRRPAEAVI